MTPKYQIFISSTYKDLIDEREQVIKTILRLNHIPIGMEAFNAANETQWAMIKRRIEESDYYVVIIAQRYGTIEEESGLSYTEKEYDYANEIGVPTYAFVLERSASWPGDKRETDPIYMEGLKKFVEKVEKKMRVGWTNKDDLATAIATTLNEHTTAYPRTGWVRADQVVNPDTINEITRLSKENSELREQLARFQQNATPMPDLAINVQSRFGGYMWYIWKRETNANNVPMPAIIREESKVGSILSLTVGNNGTLATDFIIKVSCNFPILDPEDVEAFNRRNQGPYSYSNTGLGWNEAKYDKEYRKGSMHYKGWEFEGGVSSMKPGQKREFVIPLKPQPPIQTLEGIEVQVDIFPTTGKYVQEIFKLSGVEEE